jgi:hypothetical protein
MWGSYFFLSDELVTQNKSVRAYLEILSELGGVIEIFFIVLALFNSFYNEILLRNKFIRSLYFNLDG